MNVNETFSLVCSTCGKQHDFPASNAAFDLVSTEEAPQGVRKGYAWEHEFACDCGANISFEYDVYEYPDGMFEDDSIEVSGGTVTGKYNINFH